VWVRFEFEMIVFFRFEFSKLAFVRFVLLNSQSVILLFVKFAFFRFRSEK